MAQPAPIETRYPLKKCLAPCRHCGALVQGRTWHTKEQRFTEEQPRRSPVFGEVHVCGGSGAPGATQRSAEEHSGVLPE